MLTLQNLKNNITDDKRHEVSLVPVIRIEGDDTEYGGTVFTSLS